MDVEQALEFRKILEHNITQAVENFCAIYQQTTGVRVRGVQVVGKYNEFEKKFKAMAVVGLCLDDVEAEPGELKSW